MWRIPWNGKLVRKFLKKEDTSPPATRKSQHLTSQEPVQTSSSHGFARALGQAVDGMDLRCCQSFLFFACKQKTLVLWFVSGIEHIIIHMILFWIVFDACSWASEEKGDSFDGKHVICISSARVVKPRRFLFVYQYYKCTSQTYEVCRQLALILIWM